MGADPFAGWLALREAADAAARSSDLVRRLRPLLAVSGRVVVHDLGCGTGSMARWLAPQLTGPQHWVLHDRDEALLARASAAVPRAADGAPVTVEPRRGDVTRLERGAGTGLAGAALVTASALLDLLTAPALERLVAACLAAACPVLLTLSVSGGVDLTPPDALDRPVGEAFNAHQRRKAGDGHLLGPDAARLAVEAFTAAGREVLVRPSPWRLGADQAALATAWFRGWVAAACRARPELTDAVAGYAGRRLPALGAGAVGVTVHHDDLLVLPR